MLVVDAKTTLAASTLSPHTTRPVPRAIRRPHIRPAAAQTVSRRCGVIMARGGTVVGMAAHAQAPAGPDQHVFEGLEGFEDRAVSEFNIAIIGDLHLDPERMGTFLDARDQFVRSMQLPGGGARQPGARVVQLGDLGSYHHGPGGMDCFLRARDYLEGFGVPAATILGNHDLEGAEFETDAENLAAWAKVFKQGHCWSVDVGPLTLIGLSTTRFRDNPDSVHEVHVDAQQLDFLEAALARAGERPVAIFTHAPIMGSGLKVVQQVHVKNRCAWLNHSSDPRCFLALVRDHPNIRLWFSGHFHLSHNYPDSVSVVGGCAFVQTGVIGECNRDGFRQSRVLKGNAEGYCLYTMDHEDGSLRLDLEHRWDDPSGPAPLTPEEELICDPSSGWLCSRIEGGIDYADTSMADLGAEMAELGNVKWFAAGGSCMLAHQDGILVEYDAAMMAPLGVVAMELPPACVVALVDAAGEDVDTLATDGSTAVAVELRLPQQPAVDDLQPSAHSSSPAGVPAATSNSASLAGLTRQSNGNGSGSSNGASFPGGYVLHQRIERNAHGTFFQVFQKNKWRLRKEKEAREAAEAAKRAQQPEAAAA